MAKYINNMSEKSISQVIFLSEKNKVKMDKTDFELLELLLEDGRMTFKELAKKVGIDERRASRRVEKLINEGVIQGFTALVDWSKFGL